MSEKLIGAWKMKPIFHAYTRPSDEEVQAIGRDNRAVALAASERLLIENVYFTAGMKGTHATVYTRSSIKTRLAHFIPELGPDLGLWIFDAFRSKSAQRALFGKIYGELQSANADWGPEQLRRETTKFVADLDDPHRKGTTPHNTGGAIDLTLHRDGTPCEMGTKFDEPTELSTTDFFEREFDAKFGFERNEWEAIRERRRILFHGMIYFGFVNYRNEWWHYDLGDGIWAEECGVVPVYTSMEESIGKTS